MRAKKNHFKIVLKIILCITLCICVFLFAFLAAYAVNLKDWQNFNPKNMPVLSQSLYIYDGENKLAVALHSNEDRKNIDISSLPDHVKNAFLAAEDARFYEHNGIDLVRILGALAADLKSGKIKEGASTITQQLVKNVYLKEEQTLERKFQEALMAIKLEKEFSKDDILEMYLNTVYFGKGAYGIEAASKEYFGISADELSVSQAATLAGILKAPGTYAPHINMDKATYRRDTVINNMAKYGYISEEERKQAVSSKIVLAENSSEEYPYGFYTDMVLSECEKILGISSEELLTGGYGIYTSLDTDVQETAQKIYSDSTFFPQNSTDGTAPESALVVLKNDTNEIAAVIGGREHSALRILNRATSTYRQPGSSIKPLMIYAPAIEKHGYASTTLVLDQQETFSGFTPSNAGNSYNGWVTVKYALSRSLNLPAIKILNDIGTQSGMDFCSSVGIEFDEQDEGLTLGLGGFTKGVTPLQLANAYSVFANGGEYSSPSCIRKIVDKNGNTIYENNKNRYSALSPETAYIITDILQECAANGTARRIHCDNMEIAAKTGTHTYNNTSANKDAWVVAYNPEYTMCCWMGYDKTDENHVLEPGDTGGIYPTYIAKEMFEKTYENKTAPTFEIPEGIAVCQIDGVALEEQKDVVLADSKTPKNEILTEYYKEDTQPTQISGRYKTPKTPQNFSAKIENNGVEISFSGENGTVYNIYKSVNGGDFELVCQKECYGKNVCFTDKNLAEGDVCRYYAEAKNKWGNSHSASTKTIEIVYSQNISQ